MAGESPSCIAMHCENCVLMLLLFNNENHKSVRDNNDGDGDDEIESNESQVGEVCTGWVLLRHSIVAALGHFDGGDFDCR